MQGANPNLFHQSCILCHRSLRSVQEMARESQTSLESPSFFPAWTLPSPATSHWTHLSPPCTAADAIHTPCYQPSPTLLPHLLSFLQNYFFIASLHLCVMSKSSGLCLTDLKVNLNQGKCSPSWGEQFETIDFNAAIISLSRKKKKGKKPKHTKNPQNTKPKTIIARKF